MHLGFDWSAALRRSRSADPGERPVGVAPESWKRFPYGDRIYRYGGTALLSNWARLHRGDREPYPTPESIQARLFADPALGAQSRDPAAIAVHLEDAWRAYHAGDFAAAVVRGMAAGPLGWVPAVRAAAVYASHLEENAERRSAILREAVEIAGQLTALAPRWANAWFVHALALGRLSQSISVVKALAQGFGGKVRHSLYKVLELESDHADAYVGLGIYNAEVIDKVGVMMAGLTYGARREAVVQHFETARRLHPQSAMVVAEYARSLVLAFGNDKLSASHALFADASARQPVDALERLDVEWGLAETE